MSKLNNTTIACLFGVLYYLSVELGVLFINDGVAYFWPASGVACAFFIFSPKRLWLAFSLIFIPAYLYPLAQHGQYSYAAMAGLVIANWLQSIIAGALVQWRVKQMVDVNRLILQFKLIFFSAIVAPAIASLVGVTTFYLSLGNLAWSDYFVFWMIGNCTGILPTIVVCSVAMSCYQKKCDKLSQQQIVEQCVYLLAFGLLAHAIVSFDDDQNFFATTVQYLIFPAMLFSSIRFKARFTAVLLFLFTMYSAYFAAKGFGPYVSDGLPAIHNVMAFDVFIIILTTTCLLLAAIQYELELAKSQLQQERNEAVKLNHLKTRFIANVNHEIRTPVTGVLGAANLLRDTPLSTDQRRLLDVIDDAGRHLLCLISDVLDLTKVDSQKTELENNPLDIEEVVHSVVNSFFYQAEEKGISLYINCELPLPHYLGDITALKQVLSNLISNAVKFTEQGYVSISVTHHDGLEIKIEDTGIGVAPDKLEKVFEGFVQEDASMNRRFGGTGLGLTICRKLVTLMGGTLTLSSTKGQGSCFNMVLPLEMIPTAEALPDLALCEVKLFSNDPLQNELLERQLKNRVKHFACQPWNNSKQLIDAEQSDNVFIIVNWQGKDRQKLSELVAKLKSNAGHYIFILPWSMEASAAPNISVLYKPIYQTRLFALLGRIKDRAVVKDANQEISSGLPSSLHVLLAEDNPVNAMIARAMLERHGCSVISAVNGEQAIAKVSEHKFDIVLMDVQMPVVDGFSATREIKKHHPDLPIVAFTANYNEQLQQEFTDAGMDMVLSKPFKKEDLDNLLLKFQTET